MATYLRRTDTARPDGSFLKKLVSFRLDPDLLARARTTARRENRTLTNFVETVLKTAIDGASPAQTTSTKPGRGA
jgi:hypothetical protein